MAVIATYRPSPDLYDHVRTLLNMVENVVIADDASPCTFDPILRSVSELPGVTIVRFGVNAGIARSLNAGLRHAIESGAQWLLTVDQDTTLPPTYLRDICSDLEDARRQAISVGVIAPQEIADKAGTITYPITLRGGWPTTEEVLQTGALWSVPALQAFGGFAEVLAMDAVDAAACLSLRENGNQIALSPTAQLEHQWGEVEFVSLLGRTVAATGHSAARRRSITRNRLALFPREFRQSPIHAIRTLRRVASSTVLATTIEQDRSAKLRASVSGLMGKNPK